MAGQKLLENHGYVFLFGIVIIKICAAWYIVEPALTIFSRKLRVNMCIVLQHIEKEFPHDGELYPSYKEEYCIPVSFIYSTCL